MRRLILALMLIAPMASADDITWLGDGSDGWDAGELVGRADMNIIKTEVDDNNSEITTLQSGKQPIDAELTTIAGLTETNAAVLFVTAGVWTADVTPAINCADCTNVQPLDSELTTIAGLTETNDAVLFVTAGVWTADATPAIVGTDFTGTASAFTASNVTTNADLTGEVTSSGNAATIADSITVTGWVMGASAATTPGASDDDTSIATSAFVTSSTTAFTNKTFDTGATGNVLIRTVQIDLDASRWHLPTTNPATEGETPAPFEMITLDFADAADAFASLRLQIPESYDNSGTTTMRIEWSAVTITGNACWCISNATMGDAATTDPALTNTDCNDDLVDGTTIFVNRTDIVITSADLVAGAMTAFQLQRDTDGGGCAGDDDLGDSAEFHSARLTYQVRED